MNTHTPTYQRCAAQHFGPWMVEPHWFSQAVAAVKAGTFKPVAEEDDRRRSAPPPNAVTERVGEEDVILYYRETGGVARIPMSGQVTKGDSSFGGVNTVRARKAVRKAVNDDQVESILLHIDSPGGTVSGTGDLAADISRANTIKPVYTYFEDLGASAAYWIGSQARRIYANPTAQIGSIGTMTYVEDTSKMYEKAGIKVTLIATGKYKGQWIDGNPVSDEYIDSIREEIHDLNEHFLAGVLNGRKKMTREQLASVADGRVFIAAKAKKLGLIDQVASLDDVLAKIGRKPTTNFDTDHPEMMEQSAPDLTEIAPIAAEAASPEMILPVAGNPPQPRQLQPAVSDSLEPMKQNPTPEPPPCGGDQPDLLHKESAMADPNVTTPPASNPAAGAGNPPQGHDIPTDEERRAHFQRGREAGQKEGRAEEQKRCKAIMEACPGKPQMALNAFLGGQTPEAVKLAYDEAAKEAQAYEDRIATMREQHRRDVALAANAGYEGGLPLANVMDQEPADGRAMTPEEAKTAAGNEWDRNPNVRRGFSSKENFVAIRSAELRGQYSGRSAAPAV